MLILSPKFLDTVKCPVINLHPALPGTQLISIVWVFDNWKRKSYVISFAKYAGQFAGTHAIERAFEVSIIYIILYLLPIAVSVDQSIKSIFNSIYNN